jgi:hypothetical protein
MAFKGKDGKNFGNRQQRDTYDRAKAPMKTQGASHSEPDGDEPGQGEGDDVSSQPIQEVVQEHGPAHKIVLHHDHDAGKHHTITYHGEKEHPVVHRAQHGSAAEAHDHAAQAAGLDELDAGEHLGGKNSAGATPSSAGDYGIPGMA